MGPMKLHFDIRDIFRAPRLALSGKKIWIFIVGNIVGYVSYWILTYVAFALAGINFSQAWSDYGLYPCLFGNEASCFSWIVYLAGIVIWFFTVSLSCTAVARVTYKQLKGDEFFSSGDACAFVKKHWHPVIFTSISLLLIIVFFLIGAMTFALFGKIPYVGEFLFVIPYLFYFFGAVFTIYSAIVFFHCPHLHSSNCCYLRGRYDGSCFPKLFHRVVSTLAGNPVSYGSFTNWICRHLDIQIFLVGCVQINQLRLWLLMVHGYKTGKYCCLCF